MKKIILVLISLVISVSSFGCAPKETRLGNVTKISLMLDWTPNTNHTGIYVALDKGYFKERNLDVEILQPTEVYPEEAVLSGRADFGISESFIYYAVNKDMPLIAIAALLQHDISGLMWLKNSGITSPKDFVNKTYGGWGGALENALLDYIAKENGVNPKAIKRVQFGTFDMVTGLQQKVYDFMGGAFEGWEKIDAELRGLNFEFHRYTEYMPQYDNYILLFVTSKNMIESHPDVVKAFVEAVSEGYTYAAKNPEDAAQILLKYAPELDKSLVMKSQSWLSPYYLDESGCFGVMKESIWKNYINFMYKLHIIERKPDNIDKLFTNEFLPCKK
jgi:ABC-type nitrate/sulfonate/bicarbonate transport system substrate-binding protein